MTNLTRKNQKVFASGATNNGQFGSLQAETKVTSADIEILQALAAYEDGWNSATISGEQLPSLEEFQALNYINTYQSAYLLQKGLPEWVSTATYYDEDIQRGVGNSKLYKSKIDDNINYDVAATAYDAGTTYETDDAAADTNGDVYRSLTDSNTGNPLSDGANWEIVWQFMGDLADLVNSAQSTTTSLGSSLLPNPITISNGTDVDHDIDFTDGVFNFDDGSGQAVLSALTKQVDAPWAEGNNAGGLDTGSVAADTLYHMFAIWNPTTSTADALFSTSISSPVMPSGYTKKERVASLITGGTSNWFIFSQFGKYFMYRTNVLVNSAAVSTRTAIGMDVPPNTFAIFKSKGGSASGTTTYTIFTDLDSNDVTPSASVSHLSVNSSFSSGGQFMIRADDSGEIGARSNNTAASNLYMLVEGYYDYKLR